MSHFKPQTHKQTRTAAVEPPWYDQEKTIGGGLNKFYSHEISPLPHDAATNSTIIQIEREQTSKWASLKMMATMLASQHGNSKQSGQLLFIKMSLFINAKCK